MRNRASWSSFEATESSCNVLSENSMRERMSTSCLSWPQKWRCHWEFISYENWFESFCRFTFIERNGVMPITVYLKQLANFFNIRKDGLFWTSIGRTCRISGNCSTSRLSRSENRRYPIEAASGTANFIKQIDAATHGVNKAYKVFTL